MSVDLFAPIVGEKNQHELFKHLATEKSDRGCRRLMNEIFNEMPNPDKNFVEQLQTQGFEARIFELGMFAVLKECGLEIRQEDERPDFIATSKKMDVCIEVTTSSPPDHLKLQNISKDFYKDDQPAPDLMAKITDELPIRFGSPLFSKLNKEYWKLEHCKNKGLVFAIQACHEPLVSQFPVTSLINYLYGIRAFSEWTEDGRKVVGEEKINNHSFGSTKTIPSNFFGQTQAEHVSGVIFSNQLTISKFRRMAFQKGYSPKGLRVIRTGFVPDPDPNSANPIFFKYALGEQGAVEETWSQGLSFIVNPSAEEPVPPFFFGKMTTHIYWDGKLSTHIQDFHPLNSQTVFMISK
jgi:hypothetical protein